MRKLQLAMLLAFTWRLAPGTRCAVLCAADWPQLQCNAARTGWTPDSPAPPYAVEYILRFAQEPLGQQVQPILYRDIMYIPTMRGRLYAFEPATGRRLWVQEGFGVINTTPAAHEGLILVVDLDGMVHAIRADNGEKVWQRDLGGAISAAPCLDGDRVYVGTRTGDFYCLDAASGEPVWRTALPHYVWASAAAAGGRVYVPTDGELHLYCLDAASGEILWQSEKLPGIYIRDGCPVVTAGKVYLSTMPAEYRFPVPLPYQTWFQDTSATNYFDELRQGRLPREFLDANDRLVAELAREPIAQTMFCFDALTGARPFVVGAMRVLAGMAHAAAPPAVDSEGMLNIPVPFVYPRFGRMDPRTGRIAGIVVGEIKPGAAKDDLGTNSDERHSSTSGGDRVFWKHGGLGGCDTSLMYEIKTHRVFPLPKSLGAAKIIEAGVEPDDPYISQLAPLNGAWRPVVLPRLVQRGDTSSTGAAIWKDFLFKNEGQITAMRSAREDKEGSGK